MTHGNLRNPEVAACSQKSRRFKVNQVGFPQARTPRLTDASILAIFWPEMPYEVRITDNARQDFLALDARWRSAVKAAMEAHLRLEPAQVSKSRVKRLRGLRQPQYRLRVDTVRVFYDIEGQHVNVLGIVPKDRADGWLAQFGEPL